MIALVGSGEYLPGMDPVDRYLMEQIGGEVRVACLPTAAGTEGPERIAYWNNLGISHFQGLGASVQAIPITNRQEAEDSWRSLGIQEANFVYLSGGKPDYLFETLRGTPAWQAILDVLAKGGVLAGCSAGAMILGEKIAWGKRGRKAFNLLPGTVIIPHFDEIPSVMKNGMHLWVGNQYTLLGVDGYTALVIDGDNRRVVGKGGVTVWNQKSRHRFEAGEEVSWGL
jgi:cyanophycinase